MIELDNVTTGPTLALDDAKSMNTDTDLTKQCDEIVDRLLTEDLEYIEDDIETPGKDEQELKRTSQLWTQLLSNWKNYLMCMKN